MSNPTLRVATILRSDMRSAVRLQGAVKSEWKGLKAVEPIPYLI
jgi:hypothetical protein